MNELDEAWGAVIAEAERHARQGGQNELTDYLALRQANDLARKTGVDWLLNVFHSLAGEANRVGAGVVVEKTEAHRFTVGSATMVGTLLTFRFGVRALSVSAGWPRAPGDGFVRGGGLACARIEHFGIKSANSELLLARNPRQIPQWFALDDDDGSRLLFPEAGARWHVGKFLGPSKRQVWMGCVNSPSDL